MSSVFEFVAPEIVKHNINYVDPQKEGPIFKKARQCYLNQEWDEAKVQYQKLLKINPKNSEYNQSYSCILSRFSSTGFMKHLKEAEKYSAIAVKLSPDNINHRITNVQFLIDLKRNDEAHKQFEILFKLLLSIDDHTDNDTPTFSIRPRSIADCFDQYSSYLYSIGTYKEAIKYLNYSHELKKKTNRDIMVLSYSCLAEMYIQSEQIQSALDIIKIMQQKNKVKTTYERFQVMNPNNENPSTVYLGEIYLKIQHYDKAYNCFKYEYEINKKYKLKSRYMKIYINLMRCCVELKKYDEAELLDKELVRVISKDPSALQYKFNANIGYYRSLAINYCLIKQGGKHNITVAINDLENMKHVVLQSNPDLVSFIAEIFYYLGIGYKHLNTSFYSKKAKEMFFHASHSNSKSTPTIYLWEFALILWKENEMYISKKYAKLSWKSCNQIQCIMDNYHILMKKLRKKINKLKCGCCNKKQYKLKKLKVCKGCHKLYYCNKRCQKLHWKQSHRVNCCKSWNELEANKLKPPTTETAKFIPFEQLKSKYFGIGLLNEYFLHK